LLTSGSARRDRPLKLKFLLAAGIADSTGLAFGWTVFLLVIAKRGGLSEASILAAAMLAGVALSAPFSAWLAPRVSPRELLTGLAVAEGACRLGLFVMLWLNPAPWLMVPVVVGMNVLAWSAFAAMRSEVSRSEQASSGGSLTWYAAVVAGSEALAAGAASLLLSRTPPMPVLVGVAAVYVLSLIPQWWVGRHAGFARPLASAALGRARLRVLLLPCGLGTVVFLLAGAPALLATVLAFERYGSRGVVVSAVAFAVCSLGSARVQSRLSRWRPSALSAFVLGALLVGGWSLSGRSLIGLAIAQGCAGLAQCSLEGDLDARIIGRLEVEAATTGLAFASSSRALGGAIAVALLPALLHRTSLATLCLTSAGVLTLAAVAVGCYSLGRVSASFVVGFAAGRGIGVVEALVRIPASFAVGFLVGVPIGIVTKLTAGRSGEPGSTTSAAVRSPESPPASVLTISLPGQRLGSTPGEIWVRPVGVLPEVAVTEPA
jgi:hypothetical protein